MSVFRNYDPNKSGGVNAQAFPRVGVIPWTPTQRNIRANPNIPSQPQRITPTERGATFPGSSNGGGTLSPIMSSGCTGCGLSCSGCSGASPTLPGGFGVGPGNFRPVAGSPSDISTTHSFPGGGPGGLKFTTGPVLTRPSRGTGRLRTGTSKPKAGTISKGTITAAPFRGGM